ncbi:MAG: hypothetical protein MUE85_20065 [Microscillaceae bacterium]|jgi:hypothetical protein|nr:hypothetical protein [Microscillaceae bacterium]
MPKNYFQILQMLWLVLSFTPIIVLVVMVVVAQNTAPQADFKGLFDYLAAVLSVAGVSSSGIVYNQILSPYKSGDLTQKLFGFRSATIVKAAILEGSSFFCAIAYFLTQSTWLLPIPIAIMVWMFMQRPSRQKFAAEMEVSESDIQHLS